MDDRNSARAGGGNDCTAVRSHAQRAVRAVLGRQNIVYVNCLHEPKAGNDEHTKPHDFPEVWRALDLVHGKHAESLVSLYRIFAGSRMERWWQESLWHNRPEACFAIVPDTN